MSQLDADKRARLPDRAFAYVDSRGRRRLPINDESHVRNALARFDQVAFEDDASRERARQRLLRAAKKYGIVPLGFFAGQLRSREARDIAHLPRGVVTLLLSDIEDSTGLLGRLGDRYTALLADVRALLRAAIREGSGHEVDARADEYFAVFVRPADALEAALSIHRRLAERAWPDGSEVRLRIGLHTGTPTLTDAGYVGLAVNRAARVCSAGYGGQILLSGAARLAIEGSQPADVAFRALGAFRLRGLPEPEPLYQVLAAGLRDGFPPPRTLA